MLTLTQRLPHPAKAAVTLTLALTALDRTRSRHRFDRDTDINEPIYLNLPRGTVLQHGDLLGSEQDDRLVRIEAKPEPVLTVTAATPIDLLRAAYHLGNRHVPLEVKPNYLRLSPDSVLQAMLEQLGLEVQESIAPFQPETGAYGHSAAAYGHAHE